MSGAHREAIQKQIHQDWANREYIEVITASIKRITDFLNSFGRRKECHCQYVLSVSIGSTQRKTNNPRAAHRLFGSLCSSRGNINVNSTQAMFSHLY
ncbi:uncharacterized protein HSPC300 isoform X1 [Drosophila pseudoobscura]|uniref:Uncharacterized protein HSPC300 isoform X1 n=1 Tax=Drosophila pseudoobscura pseudoobscura TaxID=46245 RepID=A0A6I8VRY1_DROPS|nr:uncharacterized protein LOC4804301 isoform X1 [Drosophila pseudoobscura]